MTVRQASRSSSNVRTTIQLLSAIGAQISTLMPNLYSYIGSVHVLPRVQQSDAHLDQHPQKRKKREEIVAARSSSFVQSRPQSYASVIEQFVERYKLARPRMSDVISVDVVIKTSQRHAVIAGIGSASIVPLIALTNRATVKAVLAEPVQLHWKRTRATSSQS